VRLINLDNGGRILRKSAYSKHDSEPVFWFNLKTLKVEVGPQANSKDRVGPFLSESEAAQALSLINERSRDWKNEEDSND
jgi:hypothetical protein